MYLCSCLLYLISFPSMWVNRQISIYLLTYLPIYKKQAKGTQRRWLDLGQEQHFGHQCFLWTASPAVMYGCESWAIKKAECQRIDAFELWCWRRLLRVPRTARRSNQYLLKEISPEYSLEGLMLKLKLQYFGHLMQELTHWKRPWCWKRWKAGGKG